MGLYYKEPSQSLLSKPNFMLQLHTIMKKKKKKTFKYDPWDLSKSKGVL